MANKTNLNLSGGQNSNTSSLILKDSECELLLNYSLDKLGSLTKRTGYEKYLDAYTHPDGADNTNVGIAGIYQHNNMSDGSKNPIFVVTAYSGTVGFETKVLRIDSGAWINSSGSSYGTIENKVHMASFVDYVFLVDGENEVISSSTGSVWSTANCPSTITPKYISVFQDRVYLANESTSGENRSKVWYSSLPTGTFTITWDLDNDWFVVNPDDSDEITALENNGNRLLIFKNRATYRWTFGQVEADRLIGVGTSSQSSVKTNFDLGITFFANSNGIYAYTGERPRHISRKIQNFVDAVSDWEKVFAEVDSDHYYLSVGDITVDDRDYSNVMFVYHISLDAWSVYTMANPIHLMGKYMPTGVVEYIYAGSYTAPNTFQCYKLFTGTDDDGTEINGEIIFKEHLLSFPNKNSVKNIDIFAETRGHGKTYHRFDRKEKFVSLGDLKERITSFKTRQEREANTAQIKLIDSSKTSSVIEGYNIEYEPKAKRN